MKFFRLCEAHAFFHTGGCLHADAVDAVSFAMHFQEALMDLSWPQDVLENKHACCLQTDSGQIIFNGLRVRLAIHTGVPSSIKVHAGR